MKRDWRDSIIIGSLIGGAIVISCVLATESQSVVAKFVNFSRLINSIPAFGFGFVASFFGLCGMTYGFRKLSGCGCLLGLIFGSIIATFIIFPFISSSGRLPSHIAENPAVAYGYITGFVGGIVIGSVIPE